MALENKILGLDGVLKKMRSLTPKLQKKVLTRSLRKGANIIKAAAVTNAKRFDDENTPDAVWREIVVRNSSKLGQKNGGAAVRIGVKGGAKKYVNNKQNRREGRVGKSYEGPGNLYYWRFLEFGTEKIAAKRFMTSAMEDNVDRATTAIVDDLNKQLDKLVKEK